MNITNAGGIMSGQRGKPCGSELIPPPVLRNEMEEENHKYSDECEY